MLIERRADHVNFPELACLFVFEDKGWNRLSCGYYLWSESQQKEQTSGS